MLHWALEDEAWRHLCGWTPLQVMAAVWGWLLWSLTMFSSICCDLWLVIVLEGGCSKLWLWWEMMRGLSRAHLRAKLEKVIALGAMECRAQLGYRWDPRFHKLSWLCSHPLSSQPSTTKGQTPAEKGLVVLEAIWNPQQPGSLFNTPFCHFTLERGMVGNQLHETWVKTELSVVDDGLLLFLASTLWPWSLVFLDPEIIAKTSEVKEFRWAGMVFCFLCTVV